MRALAVSFSDPRTEKQKNQRSKFTAAVNFTKAMTPFLRFGYKEFSGQQSAFNAAVSYILKHAMKGSGTNVSIDYNKALVTRGSMRSKNTSDIFKKIILPYSGGSLFMKT